MVLSGPKSDIRRHSVVAWWNPVTTFRRQLDTSTIGYNHSDIHAIPRALNATVKEVSTDNLNLSEPEKELLPCHVLANDCSTEVFPNNHDPNHERQEWTVPMRPFHLLSLATASFPRYSCLGLSCLRPRQENF